MSPDIKLAIISGAFLLAATALGAGITMLSDHLNRRHEKLKKHARIALEDVQAYHAIETELVRQLHEYNAETTELAIKKRVRASLRAQGVDTPSNYGSAETAKQLLRELDL